jgi:succinate dehydrogenase/fumarate reductase flavoprotein subunit
VSSEETVHLKTDLVIVGSEGAGATALIEAARRGLSAIVVTKGNGVGRSGATITGEADLAVDSRSIHERFGIQGSDPGDSKEQFFRDTVVGGKYLNQQDLVEAHVEDAPERLADLVSWGLKPLFVARMSGHTYPRGVMVSAPEMIRIYRKKTRETGAKVLNNTMVQDLLVRDGQCAGVIGVDLTSGRTIVIQARATLLATGGGMMIYPLTTAPEELTGDGTAMAFRAGVELADMEFPMFLPGTFPWPPAVKGVNSPFKLSSAGMVHGWLLNKHGERFMAKWDPVKMERATRDILAVAIWTEIMEGRGGPHGGVFVSLRHLPENLIDYIMEWLPPKYLKRYGGFDMSQFLPDLSRFAVESVPACHFFNGGICVDRDCHTSLPGLYAAGEVTAGLHGANRLSGNAFTDMVVWGHRAAVAIAEDLKRLRRVEADSRQVEKLQAKILAPFSRRTGEDVRKLRVQLRQTAWEKVGIVRDRDGLEQARQRVSELRQSAERVGLSYKGRVYNKEWVQALELENMLDNLVCMAEAALAREESRGAHYRKDFPQTDHRAWLVSQVLSRAAGEVPSVSIRKRAPLITKLEPPRDVEKYGT